jgi:hypothetical protein
MDLMVCHILGWHLATSEDKRPNDFYAGAVAVLVVIIFAKFATRNHSLKHANDNLWFPVKWAVGQCGHTICLWAAWIAMTLAFATLGGWLLSEEQLVRWVVFALVVTAAAILSLDTGLARSGSPSGERQGSGSGQPGGTT